MLIIPAIDLLNGKCVRLFQGNYKKETVYDNNPLEVAAKWISYGIERLHIIDLDGAKAGYPKNIDIISEIVKIHQIPIQIGGGIRSIETAKSLLDKGVEKVIELPVNTDEKPTGVWIGDHKVASIGVRISKGTTTHGFSLNISNDLSYFEHIIACGVPESKNTSLSSHIGTPVLIEDTLQPIAKLITGKFHHHLDWKKYPSNFISSNCC